MLNRIKSFFSDIAEKAEANEREREQRKINVTASILVDESLTCKKCESQAIPVLRTKNKYTCLNCNHRFVSTNHNIYERLERTRVFFEGKGSFRKNTFSEAYYNKATEKLKTEQPS